MLENKRVINCNLPTNFIVHRVDVGLQSGRIQRMFSSEIKHILPDKQPCTFGPEMRHSRLEFRVIRDVAPNIHLKSRQYFVDEIYFKERKKKKYLKSGVILVLALERRRGSNSGRLS